MNWLATTLSAVAIGDLLAVPGGAAWLFGGAVAMSTATIGFLRWNRRSNEDPFAMKEKQPDNLRPPDDPLI